MPLLPNILIVDDNSYNLLYLEILMRNVQANLIQAGSGAEALEAVKGIDLSLALLDVQMPFMNGFEMAVLLNENRIDHKVPIIFITADFSDTAKIEKGYEAGAVDYIIKPLNKTILTSKINVFLELFWQKQRLIENAEKLLVSESKLLMAKKQLELVNEYQVRAIEDERASISFQVHDELGQSMTAFKMDLNWMRQNLDKKEQAKQKLDVMIDRTNAVIQKVQHISSELHPGILDDLGLVAAIEWYCEEFEERSGIPCKLYLDELDPEVKAINLALFRILQEAMTNVVRHANASTISIRLINRKDKTVLEISDNGVGIAKDKITSSKSFGIIAMHQRVHNCGGTIVFSSTPEMGTAIVATIPKINAS